MSKPRCDCRIRPEVGVVHQHVDVRQVELRADGQFLDHELEVVVAGQRDHGGVRVGGGHAEGGRHGPAQRAGLPAVDPVPRLEHVQELRAGDLRQPDGGDVAGVRPNALFISSYTRCGLIGTLSKWVRRCMVRLRSWHSSAQTPNGPAGWPAALRSRATATNCSSAALASETIP